MNASLTRCVAVWLAVAGACLTVSGWAAADLRDWSSFDTALPAVAAAALIACAGWAWVVTTVVVISLVRRHAPDPERTGWAQRCVLAACGVALLGAAHVAPAGATPGHIVVGDDRTAPGVGIGALEGLALPGRTTGPLTLDEARTEAGAEARATFTVRVGDSLWLIAEQLLAPAAAPAEIAGLVHRLHDLNRTEIGSDPDLIFPGQQLRTPLGERPAR